MLAHAPIQHRSAAGISYSQQMTFDLNQQCLKYRNTANMQGESMARNPTVLICDDDRVLHIGIKSTLRARYDVRSAYDTAEASAILRNHAIDILLLDIQIRSEKEGLEAIPRLLEISPGTSIVMISSLMDFKSVREAMQQGATDYVPKSFEKEELAFALDRIMQKRALQNKAEVASSENTRNHKKHVLVGESAPIQKLRKTIERFRKSNENILINGETGTGKEVVARLLRKTLHDGSLEPFVSIDSSTIQSSVAESILFGHEKGAFTGADKAVRGIFEEADGGVIYFDEIANMPLDIQAKLLRVLQEKEVRRVGSSRSIQLDFRVIAATNRNLETLCREGLFKYDLFQRLNVLPIEVPSLRERKDDIPLLLNHFVTAYCGEEKIDFTPEALSSILNFDWPGNIRDLQNTVVFVANNADDGEVDVPDLPARVRAASHARPSEHTNSSTADHANQVAVINAPQHKGLSSQQELDKSEKDNLVALPEGTFRFYDQVAAFEKALLTREYRKCEGNISRLALNLGMDRSHLHNKLKQYALHQPKKR
jgi:two-component system response regulator AtoC